ncbi:MAG: class I SAM-dependent methyltransferase [Candidatus Wallbacteria bacterium]
MNYLTKIKNKISRFYSYMIQLKWALKSYRIGHYYSPYPDIFYIKEQEKNIWKTPPDFLPGIKLNIEKQLELFNEFKKYYDQIPFKEHKTNQTRYYFDNDAYSYFDAVSLYSMIRFLKPKNIIEVGSGYSSALMMDVNEIFFNNSIDMEFIEPYADRLKSLMSEKDFSKYKITESFIQNLDLSHFETLSDNDILFIDSTHVSKLHSDVNYIFFEILPRLKKEVYIHFHDIFYPFEYPKQWVYNGTLWNEAYLLRAFLQYNDSFEVVFFNTCFEHFHKEKIARDMPICLKNTGGSIWLKKIR